MVLCAYSSALCCPWATRSNTRQMLRRISWFRSTRMHFLGIRDKEAARQCIHSANVAFAASGVGLARLALQLALIDREKETAVNTDSGTTQAQQVKSPDKRAHSTLTTQTSRRGFLRRIATFGAAAVGVGVVSSATLANASAATSAASYCFWDRRPGEDYCDLTQGCYAHPVDDPDFMQWWEVQVWACCYNLECYGDAYYVPQPPQYRYLEGPCCDPNPYN